LIRLEEGDQLSGLERIEGLAGDGGDEDGESELADPPAYDP
jgi:hypothetical protein